jgi:hypothetical protein
MGRRHVVEDLNEEQLDFVLRCITDGDNDREVCVKFEQKFKEENLTLAKSSLHRWRKASGDELIERYRLARFQAKALREQIGEDEKDDYQVVMKNIEERLLMATRDVIKQDPMRLLNARQEEERLRLKREKLELDKAQLEFDREKHKNAIDRVKVGAETMQDFIEYANGDVEVISLLTRHLKPFGEFLKTKYAAQN